MSNEIKNLFKTAIETRTARQCDLDRLVFEHSGNWAEIVDTVCNWAFASRHFRGDAHKAIVQAAELYWQSI